MNEDQLRQEFFELFALKGSGNAARKWAQKRIEHLEQHVCDMGELLEQREKEFADLQSHLQERNATIDQLEAKLPGNRTHTRQTLSSMLPESGEDRRQRRRRERMLDEVTLICVRDGMNQMTESLTGQRYAGQAFRDAAENICQGINDFDAKH